MGLPLWLNVLIILISSSTLILCSEPASHSSSITTVPPPDHCNSELQFYCYKEDKCQMAYVKCDGQKDCKDGEDEDNCPECSERPDKFECNDKTCVDLAWTCDGERDCTDGEDELNCTRVNSCSSDQFLCANDECISGDWKCDGQPDCDGGDDEMNCDEKNCGEDQFYCPSFETGTGITYPSSCVSAMWYCDGSADCPGEEDEANCTATSCSEGQFYCKGTTRCMTTRWMCDGDDDCSTGEDEDPSVCAQRTTKAIEHHEPKCTPEMEFQCVRTHECILISWKCDGTEDCQDKSDESDCANVKKKCAPGQFQCSDTQGTCIPGVLRCSGEPECSDHSDESFCPIVPKHFCAPGTEFACNRNNNTECIPLNAVCDGTQQCLNGADEADVICKQHNDSTKTSDPGYNPCQSDPCPSHENHDIHCEIVHKVLGDVKLPVDYVCKCPEGYDWVFPASCVDKDECKNSPCDQICHNTEGNYTCHCNEGYELAPDGHTCKVIGGNHPRLLFTNRNDIRSLNMHVTHPEYMNLLNHKSAVAIDFDVKSKSVFFSDNTEQKIYMFTLPSAEQEEEIQLTDLKIENVVKAGSMAYDWIYGYLYWTDTSRSTINMASVSAEGGLRIGAATVLNEKIPNCKETDQYCIDDPKAIAVHPKKGWLFWADWGTNPSIVMAGLDGSGARRIVQNTKDNTLLNWPNGLALDLSNSDEERIYWIDAKLNSVYNCKIEDCQNTAKLVYYSTENVRHPYSITIFEDRMYWSDWKNHMIFSANKYDGSHVKKLVDNLEQPMDLKVFHSVTQPLSGNECSILPKEEQCQQFCVPKPWRQVTGRSPYIRPDGKKHSCVCQTGYELESDQRTCKKKVSHKDQSAYRPEPLSKNNTMATGTIAAIGASCTAAVGIFLALVIALVVRKVKRGRSKSMNFDNPVYKRTTANTDDKLELPPNEYQPSSYLPTAMQPLTSEQHTDTIEEYDV